MARSCDLLLLTSCDQQQDTPRTWDRILSKLTELAEKGLLPDLTTLFIGGGHHTKSANETKTVAFAESNQTEQ